MKNLFTLFLGIVLWLVTSSSSFANLEIFCPNNKEITYYKYQAGNYYDRPVVWGPHTIYGPWIKTYLNCGSGYIEVKWEIVDHYARSYYCTQTIWVTGGSGSPVSVWCPKETTIYCDEINSYYYPKPEVSGYNYMINGPWLSKSLNDCGVGSVWVEWRITDGCGKTTYCKSVVWVKARPGKISVWWPQDFEADACIDNTDPKYLSYPYGYPEISSYNKCGKYGINYKDEIYTFPNDPGICKKILRRWTIIDWCTYNPNGYGYYTQGIWTHVQTIKVISKSKPTISCIYEVKNNSETYSKTAWIDIPVPTITNSCNGKAVITHNSKYATYPLSSDASGNYPIGTTLVIFTVTDACGNFSQCTTKVIVVDKAAPSPYCLGSIVAGIGWHKDGIYTIIDPKKFDLGSYDNCTPKEKLKFTADPPLLTCDSLGIRNVKIWVEDEAGNKDYCRVKIHLQDNTGMCPKKPEPPKSIDTLLIAGLIFNNNDKPINEVQVNLADNISKKSILINGSYKFTNLNPGSSYKVKPFKSNNFLEGITTEDYTMLIDHVQGNDTLKNPLQLLAADIDGNDTIDIDDAFLLGYYLLTQGKELPANQISWRFIPKDLDLDQFDFSLNLIQNIPESIEFNKLDSNCTVANFLGIKIGDLNFSLFDTLNEVSSFNQSSQNLEQRGRPDKKEAADLKVYPNPFSDKLIFSVNSSNSGIFNLTIFDMNGRKILVQNTKVVPGHNQFIVDKYRFSTSGVYYYIARSDSSLFTGKVFFKE